jgi:multiple sugar transport system permease protein
MVHDPAWLASIKVTGQYVLVSVPLQLCFALGVAVLLNRPMKGLGIYRALFYLPSLLGSSLAVAELWIGIFGGTGLFNSFLADIGIHTTTDWIGDPSTALWTLAIWQFGAPMVIFLAALKQVPLELYEAARIDGAGAFNCFRRVTMPLITPVIFFNLVISIIGAFQAFLPAYIISNGTGGPVYSTLFYTLYIYQQGFTYLHMGYASAMAWVLLVAIALVTGLLFLGARRWVFYVGQGTS